MGRKGSKNWTYHFETLNDKEKRHVLLKDRVKRQISQKDSKKSQILSFIKKSQ